MRAYTHVYNVTLSITVLVTAVSQHESWPWWRQWKLCCQIQHSQDWLLDKGSKIFLLLHDCTWAGAQSWIGGSRLLFLYYISLGLRSCSSMVGTEDRSKCKFKEKKKWLVLPLCLWPNLVDVWATSYNMVCTAKAVEQAEVAAEQVSSVCVVRIHG